MKIVVVNLARRTDRLAEMTAQSKELDFKFERFEAVEGFGNPYMRNGQWGCYQSHKAILERHETLMVLEDDCVLMPDYKIQLQKCIYELPHDWDMLYLGGWKVHTEPYSDNLLKAERVLTTHAYIVRDKFTHNLLNEMKNIDKVDVCFARTPGKKFICNPVLAVQRESYSDVENSITNNTHLI